MARVLLSLRSRMKARDTGSKKARRGAWPLVVSAFTDWKKDKASRLAAALSFYTALSIAPLLVICIAVAGLALGQEAAHGEVLRELQGTIGPESAQTVDSMIDSANKPRSGILATVFGMALLLFGASGVFAELQGALNAIWNVEPKPKGGLWGMLRERFLSFAMVIVLAFLLLVALVLNSVLSVVGSWMQGALPGGSALWQAVTFVVSFAVATATFVLVFKFLPDAKIAWRDVWVGALFTAALFTLGKFALGLYIGRAGVASTYGAAGSVMALLIWVYYSSQIVFFGAELTQAYARMYGSRIVAKDGSKPIDDSTGSRLQSAPQG
jgi:membrane protein